MRRDRPKLQVGRLRALGRYFRDPKASIAGKLVAVLALVYVVVPADAIPDVVPFVGWLDDLGVMGLATLWLARVSARYRALPPGEAPQRAREDAAV